MLRGSSALDNPIYQLEVLHTLKISYSLASSCGKILI